MTGCSRAHTYGNITISFLLPASGRDHIAHLRQQCHNSKLVIFHKKCLTVLKCYTLLWVQRRHNCSPAASFTTALWHLLKSASANVSTPITRKCQMSSCDTLVANERYARHRHERSRRVRLAVSGPSNTKMWVRLAVSGPSNTTIWVRLAVSGPSNSTIWVRFAVSGPTNTTIWVRLGVRGPSNTTIW